MNDQSLYWTYFIAAFSAAATAMYVVFRTEEDVVGKYDDEWVSLLRKISFFILSAGLAYSAFCHDWIMKAFVPLMSGWLVLLANVFALCRRNKIVEKRISGQVASE